MAIPKVIHQTLCDKNDINPIMKANIDRLISLNPSWEHHLYDDQDARHYIGAHYGVKYLSLYDSLNPSYGAVRADLFRYLLMYKMGVVYLDIKSTSTKRLDQVLVDNDSFVISRWPNNENGPCEGWGKHPKFGVSRELQQWHIIAAP